jgi:predicted nucleotidyltransferase
MVDESIINVVRKYLQALVEKGIPVHQGIIFGSQVSGQAHKWSDIDLLVISSQFDSERKRKDVDLLWQVAARTDSRIEPIAVGQRQFEEDDSSAIIEIARREGQVVRLKEIKSPQI